MDLKSVVPSPVEPLSRRRLLINLVVAAIVVVALVASIGSLAFAASGFSDVPSSHPYHAAITQLASDGVLGGYGDGRFGPSDPVKRQQFAKMIVLACGYPASEADLCPFTDVENSGPGELFPDNYVAVCAANGITQGKSATSFDPHNFVTRYQMITMVVRAADDLQPGLLGAPPNGWSATGAWGDDPTHGPNAARAEHNGLLDGLDLRSLSPTADMTRGEAAQVLYNLRTKILPLSTTLPTGSTSSTSSPSTTLPVSATITTLPMYTLTVGVTPEDWCGTVTREPDQAAYAAGSTVVLTAVPAYWGAWVWFVGWLGDASGDDNPITVVMDSSKTIVASFNFYTSSYGLTVTVPGGHGTVTRQPDEAFYASGATVRLTAVPDAGYKFAGWGGDAAGLGANPLNVYMDRDKSITALFVPEGTYSLTTNVAGNVGGTISRNPNLSKYAPGSTVQVLATPSAGYSLHHWDGDASGSANPITLTMDSNKTVTAFFAPKPTYTLTISVPTGHGSVSKSPSKSSYYSGESVVLTPNPTTGYMFDHWGGDLTGRVSPRTVVMNSNKTISAHFVEILH